MKEITNPIEVVDTTDPISDGVSRLPGSLIEDTAGTIWIKTLTSWVAVQAVAATPVLTIIEETTTARTVSATEQNDVVEANNASPITLTIPTDAADDLDIGFTADYVQTGAGLLSVVGSVGVTVNGTAEAGASESLVNGQGQWKALSIYKRAANTWVVIGGV